MLFPLFLPSSLPFSSPPPPFFVSHIHLFIFLLFCCFVKFKAVENMASWTPWSPGCTGRVSMSTLSYSSIQTSSQCTEIYLRALSAWEEKLCIFHGGTLVRVSGKKEGETETERERREGGREGGRKEGERKGRKKKDKREKKRKEILSCGLPCFLFKCPLNRAQLRCCLKLTGDSLSPP